ncbi:asparagine synthase (glutamine-hydrolyzing) [Terasakiella sp. SH-1]|uniref:asparagine synthase (glutamine-hydrolyzing) n=1 Tax=Terasakiella sp. SH-1 TaxID=2560057 RepID=UPI00107476A4|nr:asparagine synthase (glutamine-hydrolyzing) [Terasakiella sp. SH-1]
MCGIAGFIDLNAQTPTEELAQTTKRMTDTLYHRGPDGGDTWVDSEVGVGLGHRRLAIIDLSPAGHQPMQSSDGRFVIVYNGEIYNADDLRPELEAKGYTFKGHSDTEVIVNGFAAWGVKATVEKLIGMFAIAAWDRKERRFYLVRDRVGIKPVYWGLQHNQLIFSSELKAFHTLPNWTPSLCREAIAAYLRYTYVPAPYSVYNSIYKLEPGCILSSNLKGQPHIQRYWDATQVAHFGKKNQLDLSEKDATDELEALLSDSVKRRMITDVPLGAFLSGGVDSSTVVALMQQAGSSKAKTFSIGFDVEGFNEAEYAKAVANHLQTDHTELYVSPKKAEEVIPSLATMYDEPFSDSSQIPTFLVSEMTKKNVTVALSGDGGDELFAGYNRYTWGSQIENFRKKIPDFARHAIANSLQHPSPQTWDKLLSPLTGHFLPSMIGDKIHKAAPLLGMDDPLLMYRSLVTHLEGVTPGTLEAQSAGWTRTAAASGLSFVERMQLLDTTTYMPDDILAKVDRASMACSLEVRVPILDHRVIEFSWQLPEKYKLQGTNGKHILREVLYRYVPKELIERPKAGFAIPLNAWLRGSLKDWAHNLIETPILYEEMGLDKTAIMQRWNEHQSSKRNWQYQLWAVLMLANWSQTWHKPSCSDAPPNIPTLKTNTTKKKLAYFSASSIPSPMANSVQVMSMASGFARQDIDVTLFCRQGYEKGPIDPYIHYGISEPVSIKQHIWPKVRLWGGLKYAHAVKKTLSKSKDNFDYAYGRDVYSMQSCLNLNVPFAFEVHTPPPNSFHESLERKLFESKNFKGLICISTPLRDYYISNFTELNEQNVIVLPSGANIPSKENLPVALPGRANTTHIGYVGQFHKGKGYETVITLSKMMPEFDFHLVGGAPSQVEELRAQHTNGNLHFHGAINHASVSQYLQAFDICIAPFQEETYGFGGDRNIAPWMSPLKLFEYMAHGKAIIASDLPVIKDILEHETNCLLCPANNINQWATELQRLISDDKLRSHISKNALKDIDRKFDFYHRAKRIMGLLKTNSTLPASITA